MVLWVSFGYSQPVLDTICINNGPSHLAVPYQAGSTYEWNVNGGQIISQPDSNDILVDWGSTPGLYPLSVVSTNTTGCMGDTSYAFIYLFSPFKAGINGPDKVCRGSWVNLESKLQDNFVWNNGKMKQELGFRAEKDTTVFLVALNPYCANDTFFYTVKVVDPPVSKISYLQDSVDINTLVQLFYAGIPTGDIDWYLDGDYISSGSAVEMLLNRGGKHTITQVCANGTCADTLSRSVYVNDLYTFFVPNSFTPNNDGVNDYFIFKGIGVRDFKVTIANRWGEVLTSWTDKDDTKGWDGTYNGEPVPTGMYVYKITLEDVSGKFHKYTGYLNLMR